MSPDGSPTEFTLSEFDTEVTAADEERVIETIAGAVERLREQIDDGDLEEVFRSDPGRYMLKASFTRDRLDPEPVTKNRVIEPLFDALGYEGYGYEAGGFSEGRGEQADYAISLRDVESVDSSRLLVEAEPINKPLENRGHGLDQVKSWLSQRAFESDYGFGTDGVRWIFLRYDPDAYTHDVIEAVDLRPVFLALFENATTERRPPVEVLSDEERGLVRRLLRTFEFENFLAIITDAREVIKRKQEAITDEFYEDYIRIVFGVDDDLGERRARSLIGDGVVPPVEAGGDDVRLFAVDLMNRLIFVKFLEDKGIVRSNLLGELVEIHEEGVYPQSLYKSFFEPLFYDVFNAEPPREDRIERIGLFEAVPYLNGGLFRPELNGNPEIDERDFDVRNTVLKDVIDLLERYQFSADGGPTDIDPSVLGNVFEKTINHLTTDSGDQNKELGAYYTPKEITRFSAEETVRPAVMDRFKRVLREERGWPEAELEQYDTLYDLIEGLPGSGELITRLLAELDDFYVVDPAMGSGHFLTSVVEEIVTIRQSVYARQGAHPSRHRLKKTTVQNNIYGVDIMEPAVEIGKLRLWLSIIAELRAEDLDELEVEELALPNITFNVRQGNSLIGYVGFPEETEDGLATFERWSEDSVRSRYEDLIEQIELYEQASAFPEKAEEHRRRANELLAAYRADLDEQILTDFREVVEGVSEEDLEEYTPFHWVLEFAEVYAEGGFDIIIGNPPWDRLRPTRDDFFVRYDEAFPSLLPEDKENRQDELLEVSEISEGWEEYQHEIEIVSQYFHESGEYQMQTPTIGGTTQGTENDLSALFLERVFQLSKDEGYVAQVLPGSIFNAGSTKDLRMHLLNSTTIQSLAVFENRGTFDIGNQYNYGILVFKNSGRTETLKGIFKEHDIELLQSIDERALTIPREVMATYSPEARTFPYVQSQHEVELLDSILDHPPVGESKATSWHLDPYRELDRTNDADRFFEDESKGDYPVLGGSNIWQFVYDSEYYNLDEIEFWSVDKYDPENSAKYRISEKNIRNLRRSIYDAFDGSGSQTAFVDELLENRRGKPLDEEDVLLDCTEYRIVFRDVARASQERSITAAVIPPGYVCHNTLHTIRPYKIDPDEEDLYNFPLHTAYERIFTNKELFAALGLINSIPFDYLMRTKIDLHIVKYKFTESQAPRLTEGDEMFEEIWKRSARLNCYGKEFEGMRERLKIEPATSEEERFRLQAELDAAAFHAYGVGRDQTKFVLDNFFRVNEPQLMTEAYFDLVLEKYDDLAGES